MLTKLHTCNTQSRYSAKRNLHRADFFCHAPEAEQGAIIGDFNNWNPDATPMIRQSEGQWVDGKRVIDLIATGTRKTNPSHS